VDFSSSAGSFSGKISATFDNVIAKDESGNVVVSDDFSFPVIDSDKWSDYEFVREVLDGQLWLDAVSVNQDIENSLYLKNPDRVKDFQAKVTLLGFENPDEASNRAGLGGHFYNDTGNPGSGYMGDVWAEVTLGGRDTGPVAGWLVVRFDDQEGNASTILDTGTFPISIDTDETYNLFLGWDGSKFTFKCDESVGSYTPTTVKYPPNYKNKELAIRISAPSPAVPSYSAYILAIFDDVRLSEATTPPPNQYALTISKSGTGSGTVTSSPAGINCGTDCSESYNKGTNVTLTATPTTGSTFAGWSGACSGTGGCSVTMNSDKTVTATFTQQQQQQYTLTVAKSGTGSGTVTSNPSGINCGLDCSEAYNQGTTVILTATASSGSTFTGWSGACSGTGTCSVTMNSDKTVTATFNQQVQQYTLTVTKSGTGSGTVISSPAGINCGSDCSEAYNPGTSVTLTATTASGSTFGGWSGACSGTGACSVTMNSDKTVTATFTLGQKPNLTPYKLQGWSDKIVVSNVTGTTTDSSPLYTTDTLYVDWAVVNNGPETMTARFYTTIYVDGVEKLSWYSDALNPNWYAYVNDYSIGSLSAGTHTIKIVADSTGVIDESNESDNEYTKTITVTNPNGPDLTGEWISVTQSCKYTSKGKSCKITGSLKIENIGNRDAPSSYVEIYVFGDIEEYLIKRFSTGKLKAGKSKTWKISYTLPAGESASGRNIYVFIDMDEEVEERDETNNLVIYTIP
jgi:hypothetical protein